LLAIESVARKLRLALRNLAPCATEAAKPLNSLYTEVALLTIFRLAPKTSLPQSEAIIERSLVAGNAGILACKLGLHAKGVRALAGAHAGKDACAPSYTQFAIVASRAPDCSLDGKQLQNKRAEAEASALRNMCEGFRSVPPAILTYALF